MYIQYFFTPRTKGLHVLNKACILLVIYWKTKGIPKSDNSEKRSSAHKRTKSLRRKYRGQNATLPSTLDSRYEGWVLRIENIHLFATFSMNAMEQGKGQGLKWESKRSWILSIIEINNNKSISINELQSSKVSSSLSSSNQSWKEMEEFSEKANCWHPLEAWTSRLSGSQPPLFSIWQRNLDNSSEPNF